jgi:hypothetical protein
MNTLKKFPGTAIAFTLLEINLIKISQKKKKFKLLFGSLEVGLCLNFKTFSPTHIETRNNPTKFKHT